MNDQSTSQETGRKNIPDKLSKRIGNIVIAAATTVVLGLGIAAIEGQSRVNESKLDTGDSNPNKIGLNYSPVSNGDNIYQAGAITPTVELSATTAVTPEATKSIESLDFELPENNVYEIRPTTYETNTVIEDGDIATSTQNILNNANLPIETQHTYELIYNTADASQTSITENKVTVPVTFENNKIDVMNLVKTLFKRFEVKGKRVLMYLRTYKATAHDSQTKFRFDLYATNVSNEGVCTSALATVAPTPTATPTATATSTSTSTSTATATATRGIDTATPTPFVPTETATLPPEPTKTKTPSPSNTPVTVDTPRPTDTPQPPATSTSVPPATETAQPPVKVIPPTPIAILPTNGVRP
ncbi:MAG: hypothetical protein WCO33_03015 [bacterium]